MATILPKPLFDTLAYLTEQSASADLAFTEDFIQARAFTVSESARELSYVVRSILAFKIPSGANAGFPLHTHL
jgi:hypothetical protein